MSEKELYIGALDLSPYVDAFAKEDFMHFAISLRCVPFVTLHDLIILHHVCETVQPIAYCSHVFRGPLFYSHTSGWKSGALEGFIFTFCYERYHRFLKVQTQFSSLERARVYEYREPN